MEERGRKECVGLNIEYFLLQLLFWGGAVVIYAYKTQILAYKGYNEVEIGILNSAELFVGAFFQIWIGSFADKHAARFDCDTGRGHQPFVSCVLYGREKFPGNVIDFCGFWNDLYHHFTLAGFSFDVVC